MYEVKTSTIEDSTWTFVPLTLLEMSPGSIQVDVLEILNVKVGKI